MTNPSQTMTWLLALLAPLLCGMWALWLGQDASWDLRNYHFYNPYAFLTGRIGYDVAPAQVASFYNPLLHVPFYWLVTHVPPRGVGFVLGALQGINILLLFLIAQRCIAAAPSARAPWVALATAVVAASGAGFRSELGTTFADNIVSLLPLGSLLLVVRFIGVLRDGLGWRSLAIVAAAGFLAGLAAGFKQPSVIYALGLCLAFFALDTRVKRNFVLAFVFGLGVLAGIAAGGGYWMMDLWERYGNPLFPYFNQLFHSPWGTDADYRDTRFLPGNLWQAVRFPLNFVLVPTATGEVPFFDARVLMLALALPCYGVWLLARRPVSSAGTMTSSWASAGRYLIAMVGVSYVVWLKLFGIYRYLVVVELLAPLALGWLLARGVRNPRAALIAGVLCALVLLATTRAGDWGRLPWSDSYFGVNAPAIAAPEQTLVLMSGHEPISYLIPFFPPSVRFLRVHSYFTGPSPAPNATDRLMSTLIAQHSGDIYALHRLGEHATAQDVLQAYGLHYDQGRCVPVGSRMELNQKEPLVWCPVARN